MSYKVSIRNNATGEIRIAEYSDLYWHEASMFWWTEGNFGCDCNRHTEWLRAGGPGPKDDPHHNKHDSECGSERFTCIEAMFPDGTRIAIDDPVACKV